MNRPPPATPPKPNPAINAPRQCSQALRRLATCMVAVLCLPHAGCTLGGGSSTSKENDRLRTKVTEQERSLEALRGECEELRTKLAAGGRAGTAGDAEAAAAVPVITSIEIDRLSSLNPNLQDQPATSVSIYVTTLDGRGRFTQAVGSLEVTATLKGATTPFASARLGPAALRDAYRSGVMGTVYELTLPVEPAIVRTTGKPTTFVIEVKFNDALTGRQCVAQRTIER